MIGKILKILFASVMFNMCGAIQIPRERIDYAEQLRWRLSDVKPNITAEQCHGIIKQIPALCSCDLWQDVDVQCGPRGLVCLDIKTIASPQKFKIFIGKGTDDIMVTQLTSRPVKSTKACMEVPIEKGSDSSLRSRKKEQAIASSLRRCPLQETPPITPPLTPPFSDEYMSSCSSGEDDVDVSPGVNDSSSGE